jgi:beta-carotene 3-hydroxylase
MILIGGFLLFLGTVALMEGVAYAAHRWLMHGPGWFLHRSHHRPRLGRFEANDLYGVIFAIPSIALIYIGLHFDGSEWALWVGGGIACYGLIYAIFHDVIVHRRVAHRHVPRSPYMKRIVQAHRLHHAVETKGGAVSFGFLVAPRPEELKAELARRGRAGVRTPAGRD